jgi:hypothetical protein
MSPRDNSYTPAQAKHDPLVVEPLKLPTSIIETLAVAALKAQRYRTYVAREALVAWAKEFRRSMTAAEYSRLVRLVRQTAPGRTIASKRKAAAK